MFNRYFIWFAHQDRNEHWYVDNTSNDTGIVIIDYNS